MIMLALLVATSPPAADAAAIFAAAGFKKAGSEWRSDCYQPDQGIYDPGKIETFEDLNGDGRPEAVVTEGSEFCYGATGTGFWLLTKTATGRWSKLHQSPGMVEFLKTRGTGRMPDILVGGPGFCFPVMRWNGKAYVQNRFEYDGKACRPNR
jgi:hypothetical protein